MVTFKGVFHPNHDLVVMSIVGFSDSSAIICYTNYSDVHGSGHEGNWISPDGTRVDSSGSVPGFTTTRGPLIVRLLRTSGTPQQGIYQCVVQNGTAVLYTVHVGLYNSGEGIVLYVISDLNCGLRCFVFTRAYLPGEHYVDTLYRTHSSVWWCELHSGL